MRGGGDGLPLRDNLQAGGGIIALLALIRTPSHTPSAPTLHSSNPSQHSLPLTTTTTTTTSTHHHPHPSPPPPSPYSIFQVAMEYASRSRAGILFELQQGLVDRGASLSWLSQYPHEAEVTFPALSTSLRGLRIRPPSKCSNDMHLQTRPSKSLLHLQSAPPQSPDLSSVSSAPSPASSPPCNALLSARLPSPLLPPLLPAMLSSLHDSLPLSCLLPSPVCAFSPVPCSSSAAAQGCTGTGVTTHVEACACMPTYVYIHTSAHSRPAGGGHPRGGLCACH